MSIQRPCWILGRAPRHDVEMKVASVSDDSWLAGGNLKAVGEYRQLATMLIGPCVVDYNP